MKEHGILFKGQMVKAVLDGSKTQTRRVPTCANTLVDGGFVSPATWKEYEWDFDSAFIDPGPSPAGNPGPYLKVPSKALETVHRLYPKWYKGDHLWVRETWAPMLSVDCDNCEDDPEVLDENGHCPHFYIEFKADTGHKRPGNWPDPEPNGDYGDAPGWKPSIFMPRWASRITCEVTRNARPERVQSSICDPYSQAPFAEGICQICEHDGVLHHQTETDPEERCGGRGGQGCSSAEYPAELFRDLWDSINAKRGYGWDVNPWVWVVEFKKL